MTFTEDEKKLVKYLVKKELQQFKKEEVTDTNPPFLAVEKEYEILLKKLLEKL
jgi:hypothetical protein